MGSMYNIHRTDFDEIRKIYTALKDIDRAYSDTEDRDRLDNIWASISDIDKTNIDEKDVDVIYNTIKNSLMKIYTDLISKTNADIGLENQVVPTEPKKQFFTSL